VKFGPVATADAAGCVLAHSVKLAGGALKKGVVLGAAELQRLLDAGIHDVVVARLDSDDVAEDDAAMQVARALGGADADIGNAGTGRVNLYARHAGLLMLDAARIHAANAVDEGLTVATLHCESPVVTGQMLATVKIIPYAVPRAALLQVLACLRGDAAPEAGRRALRVAAWRRVGAGLVMTRAPDTADSMLAKMREAVAGRLAPLGAGLLVEDVVPHDPLAVAESLRRMVDRAEPPRLLLVSGIAATVDRRDVVPAAMVMAGGHVLHAGMPVDPGNLLVLGELPGRDAPVPVVGIPTCARSPKLNGFDFVLRRLVAGEAVTPAAIMALGVGGLLTEIESRPMPRDPRRRETNNKMGA
jgi:molybdenum cofactor cytidylyltransferase